MSKYLTFGNRLTLFSPSHKLLGKSKLRALVEYEINVTKKFNFVYGRVESIKENGENAGYQHFLHFP